MRAFRLWTQCVEAAGKMSLRASILGGVALLLAAAMLDWVTGPELASAIFYLFPVMWMTWRAGLWPGLATALASGVTWLLVLANTHPKFASELIPFWNAFVRTTSFCVIASLEAEVLARIRAERRVHQARENLAKQTGILQSILDSMGDGVVVADAQGRLLHINPTARRTLRIPPQERDVVAWLESQQNYLPDYVPGPSNRENPLLRAIHGEAVDEAQVLLPQAGSTEEVCLSVTGRPLRDAAGQTTGGVLVFTDVTARKKLERQIAEVSDREQRRLGEDLHDGLCQHLVSTAFAARRLAARLGERSLPEAGAAAEIAELLGASIAQARDVARGLSLVPLEAGGLASALEEFAAQVRSRHRIECQFAEEGAVPDLEEAVATNLLRIAQEAVNNALKHSEARRITLTLSADPQQIRLAIEDDGGGFEPDSAAGPGMGLHMMNYRARMVGAGFNIQARAGGGTRVICSVRRPNLAESNPQAHDQRR